MTTDPLALVQGTYAQALQLIGQTARQQLAKQADGETQPGWWDTLKDQAGKGWDTTKDLAGKGWDKTKDLASRAWQDPTIGSGLLGAGLGAGVGALRSLVSGRKKHILQDMLTGGALGGVTGAGLGYVLHQQPQATFPKNPTTGLPNVGPPKNPQRPAYNSALDELSRQGLDLDKVKALAASHGRGEITRDQLEREVAALPRDGTRQPYEAAPADARAGNRLRDSDVFGFKNFPDVWGSSAGFGAGGFIGGHIGRHYLNKMIDKDLLNRVLAGTAPGINHASLEKTIGLSDVERTTLRNLRAGTSKPLIDTHGNLASVGPGGAAIDRGTLGTLRNEARIMATAKGAPLSRTRLLRRGTSLLPLLMGLYGAWAPMGVAEYGAGGYRRQVVPNAARRLADTYRTEE